ASHSARQEGTSKTVPMHYLVSLLELSRLSKPPLQRRCHGRASHIQETKTVEGSAGENWFDAESSGATLTTQKSDSESYSALFNASSPCGPTLRTLKFPGVLNQIPR